MVEIVEVGPRDGLQNVDRSFDPALRAELCRRAREAGVPRVEAVSFVRPDLVPRMADPERVVEDAGDVDGLCGLVLNERGFDSLVASGLRRARMVVVVSDTFSQRNSGQTVSEALAMAETLIAQGARAGVAVGVVLGASFGCPFEGDVDPGVVTDAAERMAGAGAAELVFADTIGVGVPRQVRELVGCGATLGPPVGVHLHDTRDTGYANAFAALEAGASILDASAAGFGGCPFAPRAAGNIATEDLAWMLDREGVETGVDVGAAIETARWLTEATGLQPASAQPRVDAYPPRAAAAR